MNQLWKTVLTFLGIAAVLVGWGITWANQNAQICANRYLGESECTNLREPFGH
jgi:hypothetical protein